MAIITNKPNMNFGVWAENGNILQPSNEKVELGWVVEKPHNETMNWLQNRQDRMLQYINQHGIPEWDGLTEYPTDAFVAYAGTVYKALSQNIDKKPLDNLSVWKVAFATKQEFDDYSNQLDNIRNTDGYLSHYVMKSEPVMDAVAKGVGYNNATGKSGLGFDGETPVITNNWQTVAEFSGGTNPKDVVTHEQLAIAIQVYKVGDIYITTSDENPSIRFGYGSWERYAEGRTLVGYSSDATSSTPDWVKLVGKTHGEYEHSLTVEEMPSHKHNMEFDAFSEASGGSTSQNGFLIPVADTPLGAKSNNNTIAPTGGNKSHNNVQPSIVVYFWVRVS